jgi:hypothetical protein
MKMKTSDFERIEEEVAMAHLIAESRRRARFRPDSPSAVIIFGLALAGLLTVPSPAAAQIENFRQPVLKSNIRLPRARAVTAMKFRVASRGSETRLPDLSGSCQKQLGLSRRGAIVEVRRPDPPRVEVDENRWTEEAWECVAGNDFIQADSPRIRGQALDIVAADGDSFRGALKLEAWVSDNLRIERGLVLAPALEVLEHHRGTSLGAAVLLAALSRSIRIPARVAVGYVYSGGAFLGHAWTEVLIGPDWIPLDSSLPGEGIADAARIALCASSLKNGLGEHIGRGGRLPFGRIDLRILEYAESGKPPIIVPADARSYELKDDVYENPWLGLTWRKPADWRFSKFNPAWPDPCIAGLVNPQGARVEIRTRDVKPWWSEQNAADEIFHDLRIVEGAERADRHGFPAFRAGGPTRAALVLLDGPTAWIILAEGPHAAALIDQTTAGLRIRRR